LNTSPQGHVIRELGFCDGICLKERQDIPTLQLPADHHLACGINSVHLED
jgi:hypothetical protein